jgi:DMSO reductase anchor subunit
MKDNRQRANNLTTILTVLLILQLVILIYTIFSSLSKNPINDINNENSVLAGIYGLLQITNFILFISSGILFILWFRRAYYNHHVLDFVSKYEEGAAAWGWIIPFFNLVAPYRIMKELWNDFQDNDEKEDLTLVNIWWTLWIISSILGNIEGRISETDDYFLTITYFSVVFSIAANIAVLQVVKKVAFNEYELYKNFNGEKDILEHLLSD